MRIPRIVLVATTLSLSGLLGCHFQVPPDAMKIESIEVLTDPEPRELDGLVDLGRVEAFAYTRGVDEEDILKFVHDRLKGSALRAFPQTTHLYKVEIFPGDTEYAFSAVGVAAAPSEY